MGYYTFREAARFASFGLTEDRIGRDPERRAMRMRITTSRLRNWFRSRRGPAFEADYRPRRKTDELPDGISFHALLDAVMAARLLERGVPFREVRAAHAKASEILGTPHPFARREIRTDNNRVYLELPSGSLEEVVVGQRAFAPVIGPYLSSLSYDEATAFAVQWEIEPSIVLRPEHRGGSPMVAGTFHCTWWLAACARTNGIEKAAWWYDEPVDVVRRAYEFEERLAAVAHAQPCGARLDVARAPYHDKASKALACVIFNATRARVDRAVSHGAVKLLGGPAGLRTGSEGVTHGRLPPSRPALAPCRRTSGTSAAHRPA